MPPDTGASPPSWQELKVGVLVTLKRTFALLRDPPNDWEGKWALRPEELRWLHASNPHVAFWPGDPASPLIAMYLGELGRRSIQRVGRPGAMTTRVAVHAFLLPGGAYIVPLGAFEPLTEEKLAETE